MLAFFEKIYNRFFMEIKKAIFPNKGKNFKFGRNCTFSYKNISVGDDVYIGPNSVLLAEGSRINIGSKVMFGPGVYLIGGDHNYSVVGEYMFDVKVKERHNDQDINIEDDVWIGAGALVLKGVRIGTGSIIGARSVVINDVAPYSIVVGSPAKFRKFRFSEQEIEIHKNKIRAKK